MDRMNGQASRAHSSGLLYIAAPCFPKVVSNIGVLMTPGFNGTHVSGIGNSSAIALESPSMAHLEAQYGALCAATLLPQPELKLTTTPFPAFIISGTKWRMTFVVPLMLTSMTLLNSSPEICHKHALLLIIDALLRRKVGAPKLEITSCDQRFTSASLRMSTTENCFGLPPLQNSSFSWLIFWADRAHPNTKWPLDMYHFTMARPKPVDTPVIASTSRLPTAAMMDQRELSRNWNLDRSGCHGNF